MAAPYRSTNSLARERRAGGRHESVLIGGLEPALRLLTRPPAEEAPCIVRHPRALAQVRGTNEWSQKAGRLTRSPRWLYHGNAEPERATESLGESTLIDPWAIERRHPAIKKEFPDINAIGSTEVRFPQRDRLGQGKLTEPLQGFLRLRPRHQALAAVRTEHGAPRSPRPTAG